MTLDELKIGESGTITAIETEGALKQRLLSFGLIKGVEVSVQAYTSAKNTIKVKIEPHTTLMLRHSEAQHIRIKPHFKI